MHVRNYIEDINLKKINIYKEYRKYLHLTKKDYSWNHLNIIIYSFFITALGGMYWPTALILQNGSLHRPYNLIFIQEIPQFYM